MYAFVLIHFGNKLKYLELEIYFLMMLRKKTVNDIIYMYSITDTPQKFVDIIKNLNIECISYNDTDITYNIKNFKSGYTSFNTLRTCNFIFAYTLTKYKKVCIIESDLVIMDNIDKVFELKSPAILYYNEDIPKQDENYLFKNNNLDNLIETCEKKSHFNGGLILFKPSLTIFKRYIKNIKTIIDNNCIFPNETLFVYTEKKVYNLPTRYNFSHFHLRNRNMFKKIFIYHFNNTEYKPLDIIKDNYIYKIKDKRKRDIVIFYKKNVYDLYHKKIDQLIW